MALSPLLLGIINRLKAWVAGRSGPPVLQLYFDLQKLWKKNVVMSTLASPMHILGTALAWVSCAGALLLLPLGTLSSPVAFRGDAILFIYLMALSRFFITISSLDTGSSFEGMGSAREVSYAVLTEASMITGILALALQTKSLSLSEMLYSTPGAGMVLLAASLFILLLAENCRVPFDDPNTHLELTMIHEVMVLDHSGPPLALILHGASLKLAAFSILLAGSVLPLRDLPVIWSCASVFAAMIVIQLLIGLVESLVARLAFVRVPMLLTMGFLLCLFSLLIIWKAVVAL